MKCPVCPRNDIPREALSCPNCGVDLKPLLRLREVPRYRYNEGVRLLGEGRNEEALGKLRAALEDGADPGPTRLLIGKALWNAGRPAEATAEWEAARRDQRVAEEAAKLLARSEGARVSQTGAARADSGEPPAPRSAGKPLIVGRLRAIVALVGFALFAILLLRAGRQSATTDEKHDAIGSSSPPIAPESPRLAVSPTNVPEQQAVPSASVCGDASPAELDAVAHHFGKLRGARVTRGEKGVELVFFEGLFDGDSFALERTARRRLREVAQALGTWSKPLRVTVRGFTAPASLGRRGDTHDDWSLGFKRASAAVLELRSAAKKELDFRAVGPDGVEPPFAAGDERQKNRTVVLEIVPANGRN